ncbi:MAG TPA: DUF2269 family protein [Ktedonobacterales bacterium]|nr:DUF2269 family protein [Ktedonobacterales bacterium]
MPWYYTLIKYLHVLAAITAVGFNATYSIWLTRAQRNPAHLDFALRGVKFMDDYVANPAYIFLLLSGLSMVAIGHYPLFSTFWLLAALILFIALAVIGFALYTPTLSGQIRALAAKGAESAEFRQLSTRGQMVGIALGVIVLTIVGLMVFKPVF